MRFSFKTGSCTDTIITRTFKAAILLEPVGLASSLLAACKRRSTRPPTVAEGAKADTEVAYKATNAKESFILNAFVILLLLLLESINRPSNLGWESNGVCLTSVDRHGGPDTSSKQKTKNEVRQSVPGAFEKN